MGLATFPLYSTENRLPHLECFAGPHRGLWFKWNEMWEATEFLPNWATPILKHVGIWVGEGLFSHFQAPACQSFPLHFTSSFPVFNHSPVSFPSVLKVPQPPLSLKMCCSITTTTQNFLQEQETESRPDLPVFLLGVYPEDLKSVCQKVSALCVCHCTGQKRRAMESTCVCSRWRNS